MNDPSGNALEIRALQCVRGDAVLFSGLDAAVNAGEILQIDGANGSGKTSLLRILSGLARPESGDVLWHGRSVFALGPEYHMHLHYVGHGNAIKLDLTVWENLQFMRDLGVVPGPDLEEVLARLRLRAHRHVPARRLSAGQRRRLALARLLVSPSMLWILDEPFTSLDADGRALVAELVGRHCRDGGMTAVATHQPLAPASAIPTHGINLS